MMKFIQHITPGERILIVLTIAVPVCGAVLGLLRRKTFALGLRLSGNSIPQNQTQIFHLTVKARVPLGQLERCNVRFVEKQWLGVSARDAPKHAIEIADLAGISWRAPYLGKTNSTADGVGGFDVVFSPPKNWAAGDFLDFDIKVAAHKNWSAI